MGCAQKFTVSPSHIWHVRRNVPTSSPIARRGRYRKATSLTLRFEPDLSDLVIERSQAGDVSVIAPRGEIDLASIAKLRQALAAAAAADGDVVLDLSAVSFLDSSGLSVLVGFHRQMAALDRSFVLRGATPSLLRLFRIAGLDRYLTLET
jgi:anti-anti-sigma factor